MKFEERQKILNRISSRQLIKEISYQDNKYRCIFIDPTLNIISESYWIYDNYYNRLKNENVMTIEDSYSILKENGNWTDEMEIEFNGIKKDLKQLNEQLPKLIYKKSAERSVKMTIEKGEKRLNELYKIKNQLEHLTVEYLSERSRRHFILSKITKLQNNIELLDNPVFLEILSVYYYNDSSFNVSILRELARTDPWRLYWIVSKETGTPLFSHSCVEMTDLQYALLSWSRIYDFAFESSSRPPKDVIEDNILFDAWYEQEVERIEAEINKNQADKRFRGVTGQEVFIPADKEGAKDVYNLNDQFARKKIKNRQSFIEKHGEVQEGQLPDIQKELVMAINREASKQTMQRSRMK